MAAADPITGGCQCGALRYSCQALGRSTLCHCRMCQKAFGGFFFDPLVTAIGLKWTRGTLSKFASSNKVNRGFCQNCGTPLTYDYGGEIEVAIGSLDHPELAAPKAQLNLADKLSFVDGLADLPIHMFDADSKEVEFMHSLISHQHPDNETSNWQLRLSDKQSIIMDTKE